MKNLIKVTLLLAVLVAQLGAQNAAQAPAQGSGVGISTSKPNCGMHYGKSYFFQYCAPKGWTLDAGTSHGEGIDVSIYPDGSSWGFSQRIGHHHVHHNF